jgi:TPR repeat protein
MLLYAWFHRDYATALRLWREIAEQGDAKAQIKLGLMYELGQGVPQDNAEALKWYGLAAAHDPTAQFNLGAMYEFGNDRLGLAQDYAEAFNWYLRAADQGDANAQLHLGTMYEQGHGVPQDFVLAHMRYNLAAAVQGGYKLAVNRRVSKCV